MNRLQKLRKGFLRKSTGPYDDLLMGVLRGEDSSGAINDPFRNVDLVYSCITYTARAIAQVPLYVSKRNKKSDKFEPLGDSDPWQQLINHPNYLTSKLQFVESIISFLMLDGCLGIIPFPPGTEGLPLSLWVIRGKYIEPVLNKNNQLIGWTYTPEAGKSINLKPHELFQIKFWNPDSLYYGTRPVDAGRLPILEYYKSTNYNQNFFDNGGMPGGVFSTEERLRKEDVTLVTEQLEERHRGYEKAHRFAVLHRGLKWQVTGMTQKDMDFIQLRKTSRESIMQIFGMKKVILGETESMNYAVAKEQRKEWWNGTCLPLMRMVSDALTFGLFQTPAIISTMRDHVLSFDISSIEALHEDYAAKVNTGFKLFSMGVSFSEINSMLELGFDSKPWYDLAYVPVQMMSVNFEDIGRPNPVAPARPTGGGTGQPTAPAPPENPPKMLEDHISLVFDQILPILKPKTKEVVDKLRRGVFEMRSKALETLFTYQKTDKNRKNPQKLAGEIEFLDILMKLEKGIIPIWSQIQQNLEEVLKNNDQAVKKTVDEAKKSQLQCELTILAPLNDFTELKRLEVSDILQKSETFDGAAKEIRTLFNASLNEVWPMVKNTLQLMVRRNLLSRPEGVES